MITKPHYLKRYSSAKERFFKQILMNFFHREFPKLFGPIITAKLADELINIFEKNHPETSRLKPGQMLWNALDKNTRADSPNRKFVPVILSIVTPEDIREYEKGVKPAVVVKNSIARIINEAYQQGGIMSTRDVSLLTLRPMSYVSELRSSYEKENQIVLPHTGALHDMGSTITHKAAIIFKIVIQKKDPSIAAKESHHSQRAVDHYLKDYNRVKTVYEKNQDISFIHHVTGIAKYVISQYIEILKNEYELLSQK